MKRLLTILSTVAIAGALSVPMFAAKSAKSVKSHQTTAAAQTTNSAKAHTKNAKKSGKKHGKKMGQQNATPAKK